MFLKLLLLGIWCFCIQVVNGNDEMNDVTILTVIDETHFFAGDGMELSIMNMTINSHVKHPLMLITFARDKPLNHLFDPITYEYFVLYFNAAVNNWNFIFDPSTDGTDMNSTTNTLTTNSSLSMVRQFPNISQHVRIQMEQMIEIQSSKDVDSSAHDLNLKLFVYSSEMAGSYKFCLYTYENVSTKVDVSLSITNASTTFYVYLFSIDFYFLMCCGFVYENLFRKSSGSIMLRLQFNEDYFHILFKVMISALILSESAVGSYVMQEGIMIYKKALVLTIFVSYVSITSIQSIWFTVYPWFLKRYKIFFENHELIIFLVLWFFHMVPMQRELVIAIFRYYNYTMETISLIEVMKLAMNFRLLFFSVLGIMNARAVLYRGYLILPPEEERPEEEPPEEEPFDEFEDWTEFLRLNCSYVPIYAHLLYVFVICFNFWIRNTLVDVPFYLYCCLVIVEEITSFLLWHIALYWSISIYKVRELYQEKPNEFTHHSTSKMESRIQVVIEAIFWNISSVFLIVFDTIAACTTTTRRTTPKNDRTRMFVLWNKLDLELPKRPIDTVYV